MAISSSPPKPFSQELLSSSPLPSPTAVLRQISRAHAESKAAAALRKTDIWEIPDSQDDEPPPSPVKVTRKRAAKAIAAEPTVSRKTKPKAEKAALKPKSTNRDVRLGLKSKYFAQEEEPEKEKPVRKTATRKKTTTTADASKVTKTKAAPKAKAKQTVEAVDESPAAEDSFPRSSPPPARRQWTPPVEDTALDPQISGEPIPGIDFSSKIGALVYKSESSQEREQLPVNVQPENFTRKRRIEMLDLPNPKAKDPKPRAKKPKKPATLTERSSAFYRKDDAASPSSPAITSFFSATKKKSASSDSSKPNLTLNPKRKRDDEVETVDLLLSPTSAKKRIDSQGFVFGTLSQLEREHHESDGDGYSPSSSAENTGLYTAGSGFNIPGAIVSGGLWDAANRDPDGELLTRDQGNFGMLPPIKEKSPEPMSSFELPQQDIDSVLPAKAVAPPKHILTIDLTLSSSPAPLNRVPPSSTRANSIPKSISHSPPPRPSISAESSAVIANIRTTRALSTSSVVAAKKRQTASVPSPLPPPPEPATNDGPKMPDFNGYLSSQLQAECKKYGFKKMSRAAMITCMEQCWRAQNPGAAQQQPQENRGRPTRGREPADVAAAAAEPVAATAARSRSRSTSKEPKSKKAKKKKKSRSRSRSKGRATAAKKTTTRKKDTRSEAEKAELYAKISEAVKVNGKEKDSFNHHILMYDPVVLEDLTKWLNTKGLDSVGVDEEVSLELVRAWCDANSVCCVAEQTHCGTERKRF